MLHTKYKGYRPCGFRQDFVMFSLYKPGQFWVYGLNLNNLSRGPLDDATNQILLLYVLWFQTRAFHVFLF